MTAMAAEYAASAMPAAGEAAGSFRDRNRGVLLAIAIVLLWLSGVAFFIAFEGNQLLKEQADTTGGGMLRAFLGTINGSVVTAEQQNAKNEGRPVPPASKLGI